MEDAFLQNIWQHKNNVKLREEIYVKLSRLAGAEAAVAVVATATPARSHSHKRTKLLPLGSSFVSKIGEYTISNENNSL